MRIVLLNRWEKAVDFRSGISVFVQDVNEAVSILDGVLFSLDRIGCGVFFKEKTQGFFRKSRGTQACQKTRHENTKKKASHYCVSRLLWRMNFWISCNGVKRVA